MVTRAAGPRRLPVGRSRATSASRTFRTASRSSSIGVVPERRLLLESVYGFLTLKNGVPVGYVLVSALFGSSEIAYNVFETFRGGESGLIYGKVLAMTRAPLRLRTLHDLPVPARRLRQPRGARVRRVVVLPEARLSSRAPRASSRSWARSERRMAADPKHRSSLADLEGPRLGEPLLLLGKERDDAIGLVELPNVGLAVTDCWPRALRLGPRAGRGRPDAEARDLLGARTALRLERAASASRSGAGRRSSRSCRASRAGRRRKSAPSPPSSGPRAAAASRTSSASSTRTGSCGGRSRRSRRAALSLSAQPGERFAKRATNFLRPARSK